MPTHQITRPAPAAGGRANEGAPMSDTPKTDIAATKVALHPLVLPLVHDRDEFVDWGWVRDQTGAIVYIAKPPYPFDADHHRREKTDPTQARVDALLQAFEIVQRLAEWSAKYPRQQVYSFSAKVDEQLIEIENAAKAWLDEQNNQLTQTP